ncbi:hypothetical protein EDEG_03054 [Edhazardia aedis USNM 41457]|uniref:Uncharacterized protein n=1 Tax=Edhazardia aedis (strain USNM 41457) TaxID=1003232 RepID=J9DMG8_EDHAE|nr:hypothetical protein EDEG_03054 [Edhazardia aedis USNM 41457]|eukprot:EJW02542.1 hypothetical protein EDEG_03054 [Edhazardia aedis USNM 41457]
MIYKLINFNKYSSYKKKNKFFNFMKMNLYCINAKTNTTLMNLKFMRSVLGVKNRCRKSESGKLCPSLLVAGKKTFGKAASRCSTTKMDFSSIFIYFFLFIRIHTSLFFFLFYFSKSSYFFVFRDESWVFCFYSYSRSFTKTIIYFIYWIAKSIIDHIITMITF